jgi:hypothetical protein
VFDSLMHGVTMKIMHILIYMSLPNILRRSGVL